MLLCQHQIHQGTFGKYAVSILIKPPIADLVKTKLPFHNAKHVLDPGAGFRFVAIGGTLCLGELTVTARLLLGKIFRLGRMFVQRFFLPGIGRITPYPCLIAMQ